MSDRIFFQRVSVYWTKKSRGMPKAALRNSCARSFPITDDEIQILLAGESYSSITMREDNDFKPFQTTETFLGKGQPNGLNLIIKRPKGKKTIVRYHYSTLFVGAPDRSHRPDISCEIKPGELLRVEWNGRFNETIFWDGGWWYKQVVYNVVVTENLSRDSFLAEPDHHLADLADLY